MCIFSAMIGFLLVRAGEFVVSLSKYIESSIFHFELHSIFFRKKRMIYTWNSENISNEILSFPFTHNLKRIFQNVNDGDNQYNNALLYQHSPCYIIF